MRVHVAGAIIVGSDGRILLAQRPKGKRLEGLWEFPGGKLEAGESADAAIIRELKEELHLDVRIDRKLGVFNFDYPWSEIALHVFAVTALNCPRPSRDVEVFRWVWPAEVGEFELSPADVQPWSIYLATSPKTETV